jgi:DNA-directed RNA polymerase specialized sigma24 family protein
MLDTCAWEENYPRLLIYAVNKIRKKKWRWGLTKSPPGGSEAHDIVAEAILKIYQGKRKWDPEKVPDLFYFICSVIKSDVNHLAMSWENRHVLSESSLLRDADQDKPTVIERQEDTSQNGPREILDEELSEKKFWDFYEFLRDEPDLQKILEAVFDGITKRSELARTLGIPETEIDNRRKRLQRRYSSYERGKIQASATPGGEL